MTRIGFSFRTNKSLIRSSRITASRALGTHTNQEWENLKAEFGRCVRCWEVTTRLQKDHIVPIYRGGSDSIENIQPLCLPCNSSKGPESTNWKELRRRELAV